MPQVCAVCERDKKMRKNLRLYGYRACKKCYYALANRRQFAYLIDLFLFRVVYVAGAFALGMAIGSRPISEEVFSLIDWGLFALFITVFLFKDGMGGISPGKAVCGVQVVDATTGEPIGPVASFKRNLPLLIPLMPLVVAVQLAKGIRIGDGWANSRVIWRKHSGRPVFQFPAVAPAAEAAFAAPSAEPVSDDNNPFRSPQA
ncbi:MAG: RDD family protein [Planctomycetes bacterium]|nr:RDD family protein [Planctomycetota bacterium]